MKKLKLSIYYLQEINYRVGYAAFGTLLFFFTTYLYKQELIFIMLPKGLSHFISAGLTEIFFTYIQLCTIISFNFSLMAILAQAYIFLRPGLYTYESNKAFNSIMVIMILYLGLYLVIFPALIKILWEIFSTYSKSFTAINLTFEPRLNDYLLHIYEINKILLLSLPCFFILNLLQRYTNQKLWTRYRGIAYMVVFSIAAFITPPDILSQTIVGLPLIIFYEIQLLFWAHYKTYEKKLIRQPIKTHQNSQRNKK